MVPTGSLLTASGSVSGASARKACCVGDAHLVIRKPAELAAPDLNRLHGHEDGLLAFAAQELAPDTLRHRGMQRVLDAADSPDSRDALPQRLSLKRGHEDGVAAVLTRRSGDVGVGTQRSHPPRSGLDGVAACIR